MDASDVPIEVVARGSFGVVVSLYCTETGKHTAAKVQLVSRSKKNREYEILHDLSYLESTPCALVVHKCDRVERLGYEMGLASGLPDYVPNDKVDQFVYQIVKMELIKGPTLGMFLSAHSVLRKPLGIQELKTISFHLFWAIGGAQKEIGFRHRDLKLDNVMLRHEDESHLYSTDKKKWLSIGKVPVLIDCNLSISDNNSSSNDWRCGTLSYMPPEKLYGIKKSAKEEGFSHDPWSTGIMLVSMCLTGRSFGKAYRDRPIEQVFDVRNTETIFQFKIPIERTLRNRLIMQISGCDWSTIHTAIGLSLFQESLGNGPFPGVSHSKMDHVQMMEVCRFAWPEFAQTKLASGLISNWSKITNSVGTKDVMIGDCVSLISSQIGMDAVSLMKDLFAWIPEKRLSALGAVKSDFYKSIRVSDDASQRALRKWVFPGIKICSVCSEPTINRCSKCKRAYFCSQACLNSAWRDHSRRCK